MDRREGSLLHLHSVRCLQDARICLYCLFLMRLKYLSFFHPYMLFSPTHIFIVVVVNAHHVGNGTLKPFSVFLPLVDSVRCHITKFPTTFYIQNISIFDDSFVLKVILWQNNTSVTGICIKNNNNGVSPRNLIFLWYQLQI